VGEITTLLQAARAGEKSAVDQAFTLLYDELRALAHRRLRRGLGAAPLETTTLVHECYLRLVKVGRLQISDRAHFLAYSGSVMRSVVVDLARAELALRRGADLQQVTLGTNLVDGPVAGAAEVVSVGEALDELRRLDPRLVQVVEFKYFCGFSFEEIAEALGVNERTVRRDWQKARALLMSILGR
jgi:RNA polymerase sigma factor (TIGR02999 family)